jgi:hypothetical protein
MKTMKSLVLALALAAGATTANAEVITINLDREFSGGTAPSGPAPWLTATFTDIGANTVRLDMSRAATLANGEFISVWLFNLNPALSPSILSFNQTSGPTAAASVRTGGDTQSGFRGDGGSYFDFKFEWPTQGNSADRFDQDWTTASVTISGSGISAASFMDLGFGAGNSPNGLYTAAHVQGTGGGGQSGWITGNPVLVPLPPAAWAGLAGLGLAGVATHLRRRKHA